MADEKITGIGKKDTVDICLEDVPNYFYDQIKSAAEQAGQTIREWIMGACHMRYSSQFRDYLLYSKKGPIGGGGGSQVI